MFTDEARDEQNVNELFMIVDVVEYSASSGKTPVSILSTTRVMIAQIKIK